MRYFHELEIPWKFTSVAYRTIACIVYPSFLSAFVLFLYSIYVTLNYEPEFSLNRTVTVTTYICFHYVRAEIFEAIHSKVIQ